MSCKFLPVHNPTHPMKTISKVILTLAVLVIAGASVAKADPNRDSRYTYGHDGYWDEHHHYHHWDHYNGHDGYWGNRNGVRVFIDI